MSVNRYPLMRRWLSSTRWCSLPPLHAPSGLCWASTGPPPRALEENDVRLSLATDQVLQSIRRRGHLLATLSPLELHVPSIVATNRAPDLIASLLGDEIDLRPFGISSKDLDTPVFLHEAVPGQQWWTPRDVVSWTSLRPV